MRAISVRLYHSRYLSISSLFVFSFDKKTHSFRGIVSHPHEHFQFAVLIFVVLSVNSDVWLYYFNHLVMIIITTIINKYQVERAGVFGEFVCM